MTENIHCLSFWNWLNILNMITWISYKWTIAWIPLHITCHFYPFLSSYLCYLHVYSIVNSATINVFKTVVNFSCCCENPRRMLLVELSNLYFSPMNWKFSQQTKWNSVNVLVASSVECRKDIYLTFLHQIRVHCSPYIWAYSMKSFL